MTPHRQINQPRRRCCPMCDNAGFKRIAGHYLGQVFQCNACCHEWESPRGAASDRRSVIRPTWQEEDA